MHNFQRTLCKMLTLDPHLRVQNLFFKKTDPLGESMHAQKQNVLDYLSYSLLPHPFDSVDLLETTYKWCNVSGLFTRELCTQRVPLLMISVINVIITGGNFIPILPILHTTSIRAGLHLTPVELKAFTRPLTGRGCVALYSNWCNKKITLL